MSNFHVGQKEWSQISGFDGLYEVSVDGDVMSVRTGRVLKGNLTPQGYLTVALHKDGKQVTRSIHRLVCEAFHARPEGKTFVNHIDAVKTNNRAANLEWVTPAENSAHAVAMGLMVGVPRKIAARDRHSICSSYVDQKKPLQDIAELFGVARGTIRLVLSEEGVPIRSGGQQAKPDADRYPCGKIRPAMLNPKKIEVTA